MPRQKPKNQPQAGVILLVAGGITLLLAALVWTNTRAPSGPNLTAEQVNATEAAIPRVTINEAKTAQEAGQAIILDVRSKEAYAANHVAGALSMPVTEIEGRLKELDPQKWIIPYCT